MVILLYINILSWFYCTVNSVYYIIQKSTVLKTLVKIKKLSAVCFIKSSLPKTLIINLKLLAS